MSQQIEDRVLALAGVFQSAALVQQIARTGELSIHPYKASIGSVFVLDPENIVDIYGKTSHLNLGLDVLDSVLNRKETARYGETIRYTIGLLHIERMLQKNEDVLSILRSRLEQTNHQLIHFDSNPTHPSVVAKLAEIYVSTLGTFKYRIQVKGDPRHLQQEDTANKVRAIFLAGVRSAMLWRQLGGSRLQLLFGKQAMFKALKSIQQEAKLEP